MRETIRPGSRGGAVGGVCFALALLLAAACAPTKLNTVWMDSNYTGGALRKAMVIGLSPRPSARRTYEDTFVERLEATGVTGIASHTVLPDVRDVRKETVQEWIRGRGIDAVLVTRLVSIEKEEQSVPRETSWDMYSYHSRAGPNVYDDSYTVVRTIVNLETNLYEASSAKLVWSATSESFDPASRKEVIDTLIEVVVEDLVSRGLLTAP